ncbi:MAG: Clp1/GlmU family protein [Candidatus Bathyarchaeota archaeon]
MNTESKFDLTVKADRTVIVSGPALVKLVEGEVSVLGAPLNSGGEIKVRECKSLPFYCSSPAKLTLNCGEESSFKEVEGDTIPEDWKETVKKILIEAKTKNIGVMVVGGVDTGKTTFTVYALNNALKQSLSVNVVDADIGQSEVGPPTTVGCCSPKHYVYDFFYENPDNVIFIGSITPVNVQSRMVKAVSDLCLNSKENFNLTVLNTDGWVLGEDAKKYKLEMAKSAKIEFIVALHSSEDELSLADMFENNGFTVFRVKSSSYVKKRSREERRKLRWQSYYRYMKNSAVKVFLLENVKVVGKLQEEGVLLGLYDKNSSFLGLGVLKNFDKNRGLVKVFTPVKGSVGIIEVGEITIKDELGLPSYILRIFR